MDVEITNVSSPQRLLLLPVTTVAIPEETQKNVIDLDSRRPQQPLADGGTAEGGHQSYNLGIFGSQVVEFGRSQLKSKVEANFSVQIFLMILYYHSL